MPRRPKSSTTQAKREILPRKAKTRSAKRLEEAVNPPKLILSPKKAVKPKPTGGKARKPTYLVMAKKAIKEMQETSRKGATDVAIVRYIEANYPVYGNFKPRVRLALARAVQAGILSQNKRHFRVTGESSDKKKKTKKTTTKASPSKEVKSPSKKRRASQSKEKSPTKSPKKTPTKEKSRSRSNSTKETPTKSPRPPKEKVKATRGAASSTTASTPSKTTRSTRGASSDANDEELVWVWQFLENDNSYYNYDPAAGDIVESVYQDYLKAPGATDVRSVKSGQWNYMVDFREMTQQNIQHESHTKRRIRRIQVPASEKSQTRKAYN